MVSLSLVLAVAVNSTSVYRQKHRRTYDRFNNGLLIHILVIMPFWVLFVVLLSGLNQAYSINISKYPTFGYSLIVIAMLLFVTSIRQIGYGALVNANFFQKNIGKPVSKGVYKYLKNPIYDSYLLVFIGLGFVLANAAFFIIAGLSFVGLNIIEGKIERIE